MSGTAVSKTKFHGVSRSDTRQDGPEDWNQLAQSTLTIPIELISKLGAAGIRMPTVIMAQYVCSEYRIPVDSRSRISQAFGQLETVSSRDDIIQFGFGIDHAIHSLVKFDYGITSIALCGCLSVSFDQVYGAEVLRELARSREVPSSAIPPLAQWSAWMRLCSGTLLGSDFPKLVEGYSQLWCRSPLHGRIGMLRQPALAGGLTKAIDAISDVSKGLMKQVTLTGGSDCAWLAALAEWLFSLCIQVWDRDGHRLYRNFQGREKLVQIIIVRDFMEGRVVAPVCQGTHVVPPGPSILDLEFAYPRVFAYGRSSWNTILTDTFGSCLAKFMNSGSWGEYLVDKLLNFRGPVHVEKGIIRFALESLPELRASRVFDHYVKTVTANSGKSKSGPRDRGASVICKCPQCCPHSRTRRSEDRELVTKHGLCGTAMADTIVEYLKMLLGLKFGRRIEPSSTGLALLYVEILDSRFQHPTFGHLRAAEKDQILRYMRTMTGVPTQNKIFDGQVSAVSQSGVVLFSTSLQRPGAASTSRGTIRMLSGHVIKDKVLYREVYDLGAEPTCLGNVSHYADDRTCSVGSSSITLPLEFKVNDTRDLQALQAGFVIKQKRDADVVQSTRRPYVTIPNGEG